MAVKKKATPKPKKKKLLAWKKIDHEVYSDVIKHCVHFSSRPANTNATPVGIRMVHDGIKLPYLSVSTVGPNKIQTDYLRNGGSEAGPFKQIRAVLDDRLDEFEEIVSEDVEHIRAICKERSEFEFQTDHVDPRLRQILWPIDNGEYLALTPLPSAGLSVAINQRVKGEDDAAKQRTKDNSNPKKKWTRYYRRTVLGIGGANSQNAGGLVYAMTRPVVCSVPTERPEIRQAFATYYKGVSYRYSNTLLNEYGRWLYQRRGKATVKNDLRSRDTARRLIQKIANDVLSRAAVARESIANIEDLDGYCSSDLSIVQQGLLNPTLRNSAWCRSMAVDLARAIGKHRFRVSGEKEMISVALDDNETGMIVNFIEELIR